MPSGSNPPEGYDILLIRRSVVRSAIKRKREIITLSRELHSRNSNMSKATSIPVIVTSEYEEESGIQGNYHHEPNIIRNRPPSPNSICPTHEIRVDESLPKQGVSVLFQAKCRVDDESSTSSVITSSTVRSDNQ
ncbi:uncharacterized protein LOC141901005 [Tubulanus polymorphus]|uniref:uncharacterized protein LOC141901005 n=1 Tax=Tubulanus polymorphus TaxID=672921 RepID=UPI003DA3A6DA